MKALSPQQLAVYRERLMDLAQQPERNSQQKQEQSHGYGVGV
jgi:hypothetical protein